MTTRRQFLRGGAIAGAGLLVPWKGVTSKVLARSKHAAGNTARISSVPDTPLPQPLPADKFFTAPLVAPLPFAKPKFRIPGVIAYYELTMKELGSGFPFYLPQPDLVKVPTWGYDDGSGSIFSGGGYIGYLGPTIQTRKFEQVIVKWINQLPGGDTAPFGLLDSNLVPDLAHRNYGPLGGRAVVHVHGMHNDDKFDGGPENGFNPGQSRTYYYPNIQDSAPLWYHDHAVGVTRLNAYAGLAALYWIRDSFEDSLNLPKDGFEIPLVLQDKAFYNNGSGLSLWYPNPWQPESFGNAIVINAQLWPVLEVEPRKYRFRMYNGANARFFRLRLSGAPDSWTAGSFGTRVPNSVTRFYQIGAEGGLMPRAAQLDTILLGNGERADVIVDFSRLAGSEIYLTNDAATPFMPAEPPLDPDGSEPNYGGPALDVMLLMKIKVTKPLSSTDRTRAMPSALRPAVPLNPVKAAAFRQITLVEQPYEFSPPGADYMKVLVNNRIFMVGDGAYNETPKLGTTEVWQFINMTPDTHPMHMHLVTFQVIGRQALAPALVAPGPNDPEYLKYRYGEVAGGGQVTPTGNLLGGEYVTGPVRPPDANETGQKDTVKANPGEVTYIIAKFSDFVGKFVYHCHILDHEENDMMQYFETKRGLFKESAENDGSVPTEYALDQNYPNPFNPSTQIRFQMPQDSHAVLKVYNSAGQEITTLVDAELPAGSHAVTWNANNIASGVYFCRLEAGAFTSVKKMLLLK